MLTSGHLANVEDGAQSNLIILVFLCLCGCGCPPVVPYSKVLRTSHARARTRNNSRNHGYHHALQPFESAQAQPHDRQNIITPHSLLPHHQTRRRSTFNNTTNLLPTPPFRSLFRFPIIVETSLHDLLQAITAQTKRCVRQLP